jgi:hypothetical protein
VKHDAPAAEIIAMRDRDQAMRHKAIAGTASYDHDLDRAHTERLRAIVDEIGWPSRSSVGDVAEHAAWLLAQHANHDVAFQKRCLELMREQPASEVCRQHLAYLEDRIATNEGRPQRFGTQLRGAPRTGFEPAELADPEHVDELRASFGLEPLADYLRGAAAVLGKDR